MLTPNKRKVDTKILVTTEFVKSYLDLRIIKVQKHEAKRQCLPRDTLKCIFCRPLQLLTRVTILKITQVQLLPSNTIIFL